MSFDKIIFYNHYHNGDLHLSRQLVRALINKSNCKEAVYAHKNDHEIVKDLNISQDSSLIDAISKDRVSYVENNILYVNTWYGAGKHRFLNAHGISFSCLYSLFEYVCAQHFPFTIDELGKPEELFPTIDFSFYRTDKIDEFLNGNKDKRKVLISNGVVKSGQSPNFPMIPAANKLAAAHKDTIFFVTNKEPRQNISSPHNNVFYTPDIINKQSGSDLNENAYIGTHCDLIVGRASGTYSFCYLQDILFNRDAKLICMYYYKRYPQMPDANWLGKRFANIKYRAKIINSDKLSESAAYSTIERHL